MNALEIKEEYQRLLEAYHSEEIDWKDFEAKLFELKKLRSALAASEIAEDDELISEPSARKTSETNESVELKTEDSGILGSFVKSLASSIIMPSAEKERRISDDLRMNAGDVLGEKFMLQRFLGRGHCGETWRSGEIRTDNYVVVKTVPTAIQDDKTAWKRFRNAFRRSATLRQETICPIYRLEWDERIGFYTVSAFLDAFTLDDYCERYRRAFSELPGQAVARLLWPVAVALDYAHRRQTFHGSLKPQNILVGKYCGSMLTDFQIPSTVRMELNRLGMESEIMDDGFWQAPEVWMSNQYGPASDQFSLGILVYQILTGRLPFESRDETELREKILREHIEPSEAIGSTSYEALSRALAKNPADRFSSCSEFIRELGLDHADDKDLGAEKKTEGELQGPHYDSSGKRKETSKRFWAVLFGLGAVQPKPPAWVTESSHSEHWPFTDTDTTPDPNDEPIPSESTFPYAHAPASNIATTASWMSGATAMQVGGGLTALAIGTVAVLGGIGMIPHAKSTSEPTAIQSTSQLRSMPGSSESTNRPAAERGQQNGRSPIANGTSKRNEAGQGLSTEKTPSLSVPSLSTRYAELVRLADAGNTEAQRQLGEACFFGNDVEQDMEKAVRYFRKAAERNDSVSLYFLGLCHEKGHGGLAVDPAQAVACYERAASNGSEKAREALQRLVEQHRSVPAATALDRLQRNR